MKECAFIKTSTLSKVANAIRTKRKISNQIPVNDMYAEILNIETGIDIAGTTLTDSSQMLSGVSAYNADRELIDGEIPVATSGLSPVISINDLPQISASVELSESKYYKDSISHKSSYVDLDYTPGGTYMPGTTQSILAKSGIYCTGDITIEGDVNLDASNIISGTTIFNVSGSASKIYLLNTVDASDGVEKTFEYNSSIQSYACLLKFSSDISSYRGYFMRITTVTNDSYGRVGCCYCHGQQTQFGMEYSNQYVILNANGNVYDEGGRFSGEATLFDNNTLIIPMSFYNSDVTITSVSGMVWI